MRCPSSECLLDGFRAVPQRICGVFAPTRHFRQIGTGDQERAVVVWLENDRVFHVWSFSCVGWISSAAIPRAVRSGSGGLRLAFPLYGCAVTGRVYALRASRA